MRRSVLILSCAAILAGCASSGRVRILEAKLAKLERQSAARELELRTSLMRVEAQLAALLVTVARLSDLGGAADVLAKIDRLEERLATMAARPAAPRPSRPQPDPSQVYSVPIAGDPVRGKSDALVTIVRAGEYACPFCEKVRATLDQLVVEYGDRVRIVHKDFIVHQAQATEPAHAACAAHKQGRFAEMDALLWEKAFKPRQFDVAHLESLAGELGLDLDRFRADMKGPCPAEVQQDMADLTKLGVGATPVFFINGRFLSGAQPYPVFKALVDEELKRADERVKKGAKRKTYYQEYVVKQGLKQLQP